MIEKYDDIYDESGVIDGRAPVIGEDRPETEPMDIELPNILDDDVLPESGLKDCNCTAPLFANEYGDIICQNCGAGEFPKHDPFAYRVEEAVNMIDRSHFVLNYLAARDANAASIRDSW